MVLKVGILSKIKCQDISKRKKATQIQKHNNSAHYLQTSLESGNQNLPCNSDIMHSVNV